MKRVITYGTFDLLHYGHINLLRRARQDGRLSDRGPFNSEFTGMKNRRSVIFLTKNVNSFWKLYVMSIW